MTKVDGEIKQFPVQKRQIRYEPEPEIKFFDVDEYPDEADFVRVDELFLLEAQAETQNKNAEGIPDRENNPGLSEYGQETLSPGLVNTPVSEENSTQPECEKETPISSFVSTPVPENSGTQPECEKGTPISSFVSTPVSENNRARLKYDTKTSKSEFANIIAGENRRIRLKYNPETSKSVVANITAGDSKRVQLKYSPEISDTVFVKISDRENKQVRWKCAQETSNSALVNLPQSDSKTEKFTDGYMSFILFPQKQKSYIDSYLSRVLRRTLMMTACCMGKTIEKNRIRPQFFQWFMEVTSDDNVEAEINKFRDALEQQVQNLLPMKEKFFSDICIYQPAEKKLNDEGIVSSITRYQELLEKKEGTQK